MSTQARTCNVWRISVPKVHGQSNSLAGNDSLDQKNKLFLENNDLRKSKRCSTLIINHSKFFKSGIGT